MQFALQSNFFIFNKKSNFQSTDYPNFAFQIDFENSSLNPDFYHFAEECTVPDSNGTFIFYHEDEEMEVGRAVKPGKHHIEVRRVSYCCLGNLSSFGNLAPSNCITAREGSRNIRV